MSRLSTQPLTNYPLVSVIIPARNEADTIEAAMDALVQSDYPNYEVILVNDRSEDNTGEITNRYASLHAQIKTVTIESLPKGWLGKNHALFIGQHMAKGELLLFTDSDVHFSRQTIRFCVEHFLKHNLDHLTLLPILIAKSPLISAIVGMFGVTFTLAKRPWEVKDPQKKSAFGIGAFNLVRRSAYEKILGHRCVAMRPDDDVQLGIKLKESGARCDVLGGRGLIEVEWYSKLSDLISGLEKNVFAGFDYSLAKALPGSLFITVIFALPYYALFLTSGVSNLITCIHCLILTMTFAWQMGIMGLKRRFAILLPLVAPLLSYVFLRSVFKCLRQNGMYWRGTFYSLTELRASQTAEYFSPKLPS